MTSLSDRPKEPLRDVAIYNPDLLRKEELIAYFVARRPLLERIVSDLRGGQAAQHHLLIGPRGMGKTTLLKRIRFAIEDDDALAAHWMPLTFPEEQYGVTRLSDLYLNCIDALSDALEERGLTQRARELDAQVAALPEGNEEERSKRALSLLLQASSGCERRLVLLLDNVDILLDRLKNQAWALRELLSREDRLVLVGASASHPEITYTYDAPFYDFFKVHELRGLPADEAREVLLHLADLRNAAHVRKVIEAEPARLRTLHTLSGGNPRTLVLLFFVLLQSTAGDARTDLERLLDHITPLYKARIEALSTQAQKILDTVAVHWHPITAAEAAARTQLEVGVVSSQITRLIRDGVLERAPTPEGTKSAYQIAERLLNIWYLMRQSRRVRQRLVWLVEFLRLFYGAQDLASHARGHLGREAPGDRSARMRHVEYGLALAEAVDEPPLRHALESTAMRAMVEDRRLRSEIAKIVDLEDADVSLRPVVDKHKAAVELREAVLNAKVDVPGWDAEAFADMLGGFLSLGRAEKRNLADSLHKLPAAQVEGLSRIFNKEIRDFVALCRSEAIVEVLRRALREGYMEAPDDLEGAHAAAVLFGAPQLPVVALLWKLAKDLEVSWVLEAVKLSNAGGGFAYGWYRLGLFLSGNLKRFDEAEAAYRKAIDLDATYAYPWHGLGNVLQNHLKRFDEAEAAYRKAIDLDASFAYPWRSLGYLLQYHLKRFDEAEAAYRNATELDPGRGFFWNSLAWCRYTNGKIDEETEEAARKAVRLDPENLHSAHTLASILVRRGKWDEPAALMSRVIHNGSPEYFERTWDDIVRFFADCVRVGRAAVAIELLDAIGFGERWLPMRAAVRATMEGRESLLRLAPELRAPAEELYDSLVASRGPSGDGGAAPLAG